MLESSEIKDLNFSTRISTTEQIQSYIDDEIFKECLKFESDNIGNVNLSGDLSLSGDLNLTKGDLNLVDINFVQKSQENLYENIPYVECFADRNSFLQAEEAFDEKLTTYGYACTGSKGYCVLSAVMPEPVDGEQHVIFTLSGTPDDELIRYVNCTTIEDRQSLLTRDGNQLAIKSTGFYNKWTFTTTNQFAQCFEMPYGINSLETSKLTLDFEKYDNAYVKNFISANSSNEIDVFILDFVFDKSIALNDDLSNRIGYSPEEYLSAWYFDNNALYTADYPQLGNQVIYNFFGNSAQGGSTKAIDKYAHVEGRASIAMGRYSHAEGGLTIAGGLGSHAEGTKCRALGNYSHAEGNQTQAIGLHAHSEGQTTKAYGKNSHAEGYKSEASGLGSHTEGLNSVASNECAHAEGKQTTASGKQSHSEGHASIASGESSHAEGRQTQAIGKMSHAEGYSTTASGWYTHAEGLSSVASGNYSHAEGNQTTASGESSHASGNKTLASGNYSFAHGSILSATNTASIALGYKCNAANSISFVWNGDNKVIEPVTTTSTGQFKINPRGGFTNFYIGENNFVECVLSAIESMDDVQINKLKQALKIN